MMLLFTSICKRVAGKGLDIVIAKVLIWALAFGLIAAIFGIGFFFYEPLDGEMAVFGIAVYAISWGIGILVFRLRNKVSAANAEIG